MSADSPVLFVPNGDDPLVRLALLLLEQHQDQLPDLSRHVVLLPHRGAKHRFRGILRAQAGKKGFTAVLPPGTFTLSDWANRFADGTKHRLSATARAILLLDLLEDQPRWRRDYGDWPLADSLSALFDEMALHQCRMPATADEIIDKFIASHDDGRQDMSPFSDEARFVHAMWQAWCHRLEADGLQDRPSSYLDGLTRSLEQHPRGSRIYLAGAADMSKAETGWIESLLARHCLTWVLHGTDSVGKDAPASRLLHSLEAFPAADAAHDAYAEFLGRAFAEKDGQLRARALKQAVDRPESPAQGRLVLHQAANAESEARAIDVQVRRWLTLGQRDIGIVTNDRKLARRVRALLERAGVGLEDAGGWALSTTSAAAALARLLECVEQNFNHVPLLDLLKSPFLQFQIGGWELGRLAPVFEQQVVRAQNITYGLDNYLFGIDRARDIRVDDADTDSALRQLMGKLESAVAPLMALRRASGHPATDFLDALRTCLELSGLSAGFDNDAAGRELGELLRDMQSAASRAGMRLSWSGFHQWLRREMEQRRFHPPMKGRGVELMSFAESRLYRFDALIIAGAVREHLPGQLGAPPYFNDSVRKELGLPSLAQRYSAMQRDFRRLLEAAPRILVTLRREHEGERIQPCPWVEQLRAFHELAYHSSLNDPELEWLVQQPAATIVDRSSPLPSPVSPPAARLPPAMLPPSFTATDIQRLVDCPYQFFAASGLGLAPAQEIREEMEKKDYGTHVHRILQAFHAGVSGLPGPWRKKLDDAMRAEAGDLLRQISEKVFAGDLRRRFLARGWLYRWERCIPAYLDWEQQRAAAWTVAEMEIRKESTLAGEGTAITLRGRIDRLDRSKDGMALIDYKTGAVPERDDVLHGENIQLPFYALLLEQDEIAQAMFVALGDEEVQEKTALDSATLSTLRLTLRDRLLRLKRGLEGGTPLPAWGDMETCRKCDMEGLCRRGLWVEPPAPA